MPIETELKFSVPDKSVFRDIRTLETIADYRLVDKGVVHITDYCFDTPDRRLFNGKIVFRMRVMHHKSVLTFKQDSGSEGSYYRRREIEAETEFTPDDIAAGNLPDITPVHAFHEAVGKVPLEVSLTTVNRRHGYLLTWNNTPHYELVLDDVTFNGPRGSAHVLELEVELLFDTDNDLESIGAWLTGRFALRPAGPSKYILGMNLVGGV